MAWIESHQSLSKHRKTLRAAGRLSVDRATLIGHLHILWWWGLDNVTSDGHLGDITDYEIAEAAEWKGEPKEFVAALIEAGFIDDENGEKHLHDWFDYAGKLLEKREKERERSRQRRANDQPATAAATNGRPSDDQEKTDGTVPYRTVPNQKKDIVPFGDIITHLNAKTGKEYKSTTKATRRHINARWKEGHRLPDFIAVIDNKTAEWKGTDMERYLRPETLFGTKFEGYLNAAKAGASPRGRPDNEYAWIDAELARLEAAGGDA